MSTIHDIVWIMNYKFLLKNYTCWINFSFFLCFKFFLDLGLDENFKHIKNWKGNGNLEIYGFYNITTKKYLLHRFSQQKHDCSFMYPNFLRLLQV